MSVLSQNTPKAEKKTDSILPLKRLDFIDVAKGIGILFVIIAHINYKPSLLTVIYSFHMPLFFFFAPLYRRSFPVVHTFYRKNAIIFSNNVRFRFLRRI